MEKKPEKILFSHKIFAEKFAAQTLSQEKFAEKINISDRYIRDLKSKDKNVSAALLYKISREFGCSMESMLTINQPEQTTDMLTSLYPINQLILKTLQNNRQRFINSKITITTVLDKLLPDILLNKQQIEQVLVNCLNQSYIDILDSKKSNGAIFIYTHFCEEKGTVQIIISDNGPGKQRKQDIDIIGQYAGKISVSSQFGQGCCVRIELPVPQDF